MRGTPGKKHFLTVSAVSRFWKLAVRFASAIRDLAGWIDEFFEISISLALGLPDPLQILLSEAGHRQGK
jgi:hypothetical protein